MTDTVTCPMCESILPPAESLVTCPLCDGAHSVDSALAAAWRLDGLPGAMALDSSIRSLMLEREYHRDVDVINARVATTDRIWARRRSVAHLKKFADRLKAEGKLVTISTPYHNEDLLKDLK